MDFVDYYFDKNTFQARATPTPNNGNYKLFSISYPMLAKTVSKAGNESPTGQATNVLKISVDGAAAVDVVLPEGFPSVTELINNVNTAIANNFPTKTKYCLLQEYGQSQARWINSDAVSWSIDYVNLTTKQIIRGEDSGTLTYLFPANTVVKDAELFTPDPTLGLNSLEFRIANGEKISIPATGKWLDNVLFYFDDTPDVVLQNSNNSRLVANFASLRITKDLYSPRVALIRLAIENYAKVS